MIGAYGRAAAGWIAPCGGVFALTMLAHGEPGVGVLAALIIAATYVMHKLSSHTPDQESASSPAILRLVCVLGVLMTLVSSLSGGQPLAPYARNLVLEAGVFLGAGAALLSALSVVFSRSADRSGG